MKTHITPTSIFRTLHEVCGQTITDTFSGGREDVIAEPFAFSSDLDVLNSMFQQRPETQLYILAQREYLTAMLNLCQGQYRNAFKGLRLALELLLQGVYLSVDLLALQEWLTAQKDTNWSSITDPNIGLFSSRYCDAFFPELSDRVPFYGNTARSLYRELSECTHGNLSNSIPLPDSFTFNNNSFSTWLEKAVTLKLIAKFAFAMRYLKWISETERESIRHLFLDDLSHIEPVRVFLGGPAT